MGEDPIYGSVYWRIIAVVWLIALACGVIVGLTDIGFLP